jgi:hypothetical protein
MQPAKIPNGTPIKNAGIYHLSTGTWTRGSAATAALGNDAAYVNDVNTNYFTGFGVGDFGIDEGRLPGPTTQGNRSSYVINGFQFGYCADYPQFGGTFELGFYDAYDSCTAPGTVGAANPDRLIVLNNTTISGLPAGGTSFGCWIVTIDLMNTTAEFKLKADGEGSFDSSTPADSFGWSIEWTSGPGTNGFASGPLLNGDPNYFPEGDGTYYQNPAGIPTTFTGTGLDTEDRFYGVGPGFLPTYTCYFFGGYKNTIGPGLASVPYGSMWLSLYSDENNVHNFLRYCTGDSVPNGSTGLNSVMRLETQDAGGGLVGFDTSISGNTSGGNRLEMIVSDAPGPGNGQSTNIGYFIMGTGQNTFTPPGSVGPICVAGGIKRYLPPVSKTSETIVFHDLAGSPTTLTGQGFERTALGAGAHEVGTNIGTTAFRYSFQAWHRDGTFPSNLSDAICVDFVP